MSERFKLRESITDPNAEYVDFPNGYIEIHGARAERERIARIIVDALNNAESTKGTER